MKIILNGLNIFFGHQRFKFENPDLDIKNNSCFTKHLSTNVVKNGLNSRLIVNGDRKSVV